MAKLSGLQPVAISSPKVIVTQPSGIVPKVTPLPDASKSGQVTSPSVLPTSAEVSGLVDAATAQPTE